MNKGNKGNLIDIFKNVLYCETVKDIKKSHGMTIQPFNKKFNFITISIHINTMVARITSQFSGDIRWGIIMVYNNFIQPKKIRNNINKT